MNVIEPGPSSFQSKQSPIVCAMINFLEERYSELYRFYGIDQSDRCCDQYDGRMLEIKLMLKWINKGMLTEIK